MNKESKVVITKREKKGKAQIKGTKEKSVDWSGNLR